MTSPLQGEDRRFDSAPAHHSRRKQKMLGQNFLIDDNIANKIVNLASIKDDEKILEIGPGRGILTDILVKKGKLLAVEKDKWLAVVLKQKFSGEAEIIEADILDFEIPDIDVIVANLPYSISSPILFRLFKYKWERAVLMFQEEFANRLVAKPGSKIYGRLSVMANHYVETKKLFKVSKTAFQPQPKIHSQVVKLTRREPNYVLDDFTTFENWFTNEAIPQIEAVVGNDGNRFSAIHTTTPTHCNDPVVLAFDKQVSTRPNFIITRIR